MVDSLGLLLLVMVHAANIADVTAAKTVFSRLKLVMTRLVIIWADRGYEGLEGWLVAQCAWVLHRPQARTALPYCRGAGWWNVPSRG